MSIRIGVDIGGTFTDLQILDGRGGAAVSVKTPTTPEDPSLGLMTGIKAAAARGGFQLSDVDLVLHGTTIATNAVLERKLPRGALVATQGFEDVLEIGRHNRRDVYGLQSDRPPPLIPRDRRLGLAERIGASGAVELALTPAAIDAVLAEIDRIEAECVAVALLNAYVNPAHEEAFAAALARARPGLALSLSSQISPEIREYERSSTTVLNALLIPVVRSYLEKLERRMAAEGFSPRLMLVQSNGGVCSPAVAALQPARLLLSGPSGGALAARRIARDLGRSHLVGVDMGGTSFDVCVVEDGAITLVTQGEIDRLPVRLPMVEIRTIGAGGGSIAAVDGGGRLSVGPRSAGAVPGPVCYGRGGLEPTVTDANLLLGRLDPAFFLGGAMALDLEGARRAVAEKVATPLGLAPDDAAAGLLTVTNHSLAAAIRLSLFEKGLDPRDFAMLSFGGAGGIHAIDVAEALGMTEVIFPRDASTLSAFGILHSDVVLDFAQSRILPAVPGSLGELATVLDDLRGRAAQAIAREGLPAETTALTLAADMRYRGQAFELMVPWSEMGRQGAPGPSDLAALLERFHRLHRQRFSYADPEEAVEIVTLRLVATTRLPQPSSAAAAGASPAVEAGSRPVHFEQGWVETAVHRRDGLELAGALAGPAVIEEDYTTLLITPGWRATVAAGGHIVATRVGG